MLTYNTFTYLPYSHTDAFLPSSQLMESFIHGNAESVIELAHKFMLANNYKCIDNRHIDKFLGGWTPKYLHAPGKGWGMSTLDAIRCLYDIERTATFTKGIYKAVQTIRQKYPSQEIVAIDAGCGTGITSVALAYAGCDSVIGLDINPDTVSQAKRFVEHLELSERITIQLEDATQYNPGRKVHIIHSENLYTGLIYEPQIQILNNLKQYLDISGVVIPESITLHMTPLIVDWTKIPNITDSIELKHLPTKYIMYRGTRTTIPIIYFKYNKSENDYVKTILHIDKTGINGILTEMDVSVFENIQLKSDSAKFLGTSEIFKVTSPNINQGEKGLVMYKAGGNPPRVITPLV